MPYTAVSVGWGWTVETTPLKDNLIRRNRVHNVMRLLSDGGGIYTLSKQPGTIIAENYIFDIVRSEWAGEFPISAIYLDEGSSLITLTNNVIENVPVGIDLHEAEYNTVINNMERYQGRAGSSYNDFIRKDFTGFLADRAIIKNNAGINQASISLDYISTLPSHHPNLAHN